MNEPEFTLDWPHGWKTRDESGVEIYCTDAPGPFPIHGRVRDLLLPVGWRADGRCRSEKSGFDLINRPAPVVSVPMDKLHGGTMLESFILQQAIIAPEDPSLKPGSTRYVKWFFTDEVGVSK